MGIQIFIQLLICALVVGTQSAPANGTDDKNSTESEGRSGRKYDDQQQFVTIPIGYYKPRSQSPDVNTDSDPAPKYKVPSSFDEFVSSDKKPRDNYPSYYTSRGDSYKDTPPKQVSNWKGDPASDDDSPTWIVPSPADMMTMIDLMKGMSGDQTSDDQPTGLLSKLTSDPVTTLVAIILPVSIVLLAVMPALSTLFAGTQNIPTVTTVASGNTGRKLDETQSLAKNILEAIENFRAKNASEPACLQKSICEIAKGKNGTNFKSVQNNLQKALAFVDDFWLETLGVKQLMLALKNGNCDEIQCSTARKAKENDNTKKIS